MTVRINYIGNSNVRIIKRADVLGHGLTDPLADLQWDRSNSYERDVSNDLAAFLIAQGDFQSDDGMNFGQAMDQMALPNRLYQLCRRLYVAGHSIAASGGAVNADRGWANILAELLNAQDMSIAKGGAVLTYHDRGQSGQPFWNKPFPINAAPGDGGYVTFMQHHAGPQRGILWKGPWSAATTYTPGDGVYTSGGARWWRCYTTNINVDPNVAPGASWLEVTAMNTAQWGDEWLGLPGFHVMSFGLNDLGWVKNLNIFLHALRAVWARAFATKVMEDDDAFLEYTGAHWATGFNTYFNSGNTYKNISAMGVGEKVQFYTPPTFPGGKVRFGFFQRATIDITNGVVALGGKFDVKIDGALNSQIDMSIDRSAPYQLPATFSPWVHTVTLPAGKHLIEMTCSTAIPGAHANFFDYVSFDSSVAPAGVFVGMTKPLVYTAYTNPLPVDADVDAWNVGMKNLIETEFPSVLFVNPLDVIAKTAANYSFDSLHPNTEAHGKLGLYVYKQMRDRMTITEEQIAMQSTELRSGSSSFLAKFGKTTAGGVNQVIPHGTGLITNWTDIVQPLNGTVEGIVNALPLDLLRISFNALWNTEDDEFGYIDFVTVVGGSNGVGGVRKNFVSLNGPVPATNGINIVYPDAVKATPMLSMPAYYVVRPEDLTNGGAVVFRAVATTRAGAGGRIVLMTNGSPLTLQIENLGIHDPSRMNYVQ